jgi:hypothetical protein
VIVFSGAHVLAELSAGRPLTHARIGIHNWLRDLSSGAVVASSEVDGFPADAVLRPDTGEGWKPASLPATLQINLGTSRAINYIGVLGTLGSSGVSAKWETSPDGVNFEDFALEMNPGDDAPIMFLDDEVLHRSLLLTLTGDAEGEDEMPIVSVCYAGELLVMERAIYRGVTPPSLARQTVLHGSESEGGQILGQGFRRLGVSGSMPFQGVKASFYRSEVDPFVRAARRTPAFIAWRPANYPKEVIYARIVGDVHPQNSGPRDLMSFELPYRGVGHV